LAAVEVVAAVVDRVRERKIMVAKVAAAVLISKHGFLYHQAQHTPFPLVLVVLVVLEEQVLLELAQMVEMVVIHL